MKIKRPTDEIEIDESFFEPADIYTIDGWYSVPTDGNEWFIAKGKIYFSNWSFLANLSKERYHSIQFDVSFNTQKECEKYYKLKAFL